MKRLAATLCVLALAATGPALGARNPSVTGLPTQSCEEQPSGPPGFDTAGFANAQGQYNPISQYDVACYQVSQPHPGH
jgi:hypothetical protein